MAEGEVKQSFFKGVKTEFKKIAWPGTERVAKETLAVIIISVILGLIIALIDYLFQLGLGQVIK